MPELRRVFGKNGGKDDWMPGDRIVQKDLAQTLRHIAEHGADGFYKGPVADLLAAEMQRGKGLITKSDLDIVLEERLSDARTLPADAYLSQDILDWERKHLAQLAAGGRHALPASHPAVASAPPPARRGSPGR